VRLPILLLLVLSIWAQQASSFSSPTALRVNNPFLGRHEYGRATQLLLLRSSPSPQDASSEQENTLNGEAKVDANGEEIATVVALETVLIPPPIEDKTVSRNDTSAPLLDTLLVSQPLLAGMEERMGKVSAINERSRLEVYLLLQAALIGILGGAAVALFKTGIEETRHLVYGAEFASQISPLIPAFGGLVVGSLALAGSFPPGLKGSIRETDNDSRRVVSGNLRAPRHPFGFVRKTLASVATLGTGSSLGPEGPSVEVGLSMSRLVMNTFPPLEYLLEGPGKKLPNVDEADIVQRGRLLLSCGAAAGVSAGFNAPLAGVFFVLEIVEKTFNQVDAKKKDGGSGNEERRPQYITSLLVASVLSALVFRAILGNEAVLNFDASSYDLKTPLSELPLYIILGTLCGIVSDVFGGMAKVSKSAFKGNIGPTWVREAIQQLPYMSKPAVGGLICGFIAIPYPQILFFGYEYVGWGRLCEALFSIFFPFSFLVPSPFSFT